MLLLYSQCLPPPTHSTIHVILCKLFDLYHLLLSPWRTIPYPPLTVPLCARRCGHTTQFSCSMYRNISPCMFRSAHSARPGRKLMGQSVLLFRIPLSCRAVRWAADMVSGFRNPVYPASSLSAGAFQDIVDHHTKTFKFMRSAVEGLGVGCLKNECCCTSLVAL